MSASCDRTEHANLLPLQHLVEHLHWGCTDQAQQVWLLEAVFAEHAHQLAEQALRVWGREGSKRLAVDEDGLPLYRSPFYMHEDADTAADLIDPEATP
ncbi:hypothetical protein OG552_10715 [Streptomyces sp. NBC_01476]|uniref:hypothetical protein n=1 Tax=Streptomyces sp. NBC_01476 TaxID=2903881 RepID=UPI002E2EBC2C|nr:hypothetical protein [Streptomyces sp. NBC_01476]